MKLSTTTANTSIAKKRIPKFQIRLLQWFDQHGRKTLPWQLNKTPYRVWVSEIMLQQTQVNTVISYFERFMQRFPDLSSLARATETEVLHLWAGLGYYSRARNLLKAAQKIVKEHKGKFPKTVAELMSLPGIGQSTAGAILSIAFNQSAPILDGNVKRVLTRLHGIKDPVNEKITEKKLWDLTHAYIPKQRAADYTQALMDLGATLCTRAKPNCERCPFKKECYAYQSNTVTLLPAKKRTAKIPTRSATLLILKKESFVFLEKRPSPGIWGGLYCLPQISGKSEKAAIQQYCQKQYQLKIKSFQLLKVLKHTFTHFHLNIIPVLLEIEKIPTRVMEDLTQIWYNLQQPEAIGLPKPIKVILEELT